MARGYCVQLGISRQEIADRQWNPHFCLFGLSFFSKGTELNDELRALNIKNTNDDRIH